MSNQSRNPRSNESQISSQTANYFEELSDTELAKFVNDLKHQIKVIRLENEILEKTIMRLDPSMMQGVFQALDYANKLQNQSISTGSVILKSQTSRLNFDSLFSPSRILASPSRVSSRKGESMARYGGNVVVNNRINVLEKSEFVATEMENLIRDRDRVRIKAAKKHALIKAMDEEVSVQITDSEKSTTDFEAKVIQKGWDSIAQRIPAEIWVRYMIDWGKGIDVQISKLRLRYSTLNVQFRKCKNQMATKVELSESLRPVDFEKHKILNEECLAVIAKKRQQLEEVKALTGDANLNLSVYRKAMAIQNQYLARVNGNIKHKMDFIQKLLKETGKITLEVVNLDNNIKEVRKARLKYDVPQLTEYILLKSEQSELERDILAMEKKLASLENGLRTFHKLHNSDKD